MFTLQEETLGIFACLGDYGRYYQIDETQTGLVGTQCNDSWDVDFSIF